MTLRPFVARSALASGALLFSTAILVAQGAPQLAQLETARVARGAIVVLLVNGPKDPADATMTLERANAATSLRNAKYTPPPAGAARGQISGDVDITTPLGEYAVTAQVGTSFYSSGPARVVIVPSPNAEVHLNELAPKFTYETRTEFVPAEKADATTKSIARKTIDLTLRGTGFIVKPPQENAIWINDVRTSISWDGCQNRTVGTQSAPQPLAIHGEVVSAEEMKLCGIEVPASGELKLNAGFGDTKSESRNFTVFSMTTSTVTWLSVIIAVVLALLPLALLSRVRHAYRIAGKEYRYLSALFLDPETHTYSLSKLQFYLWTMAALFGYSFLYISRVFVQNQGWPDVPGTLPAIIGMSAGTAIGSQIVTSVKGSKGAGGEEPRIADLVTSGGVVAVDRVQMLLWTLFGVGAFTLGVWHDGTGTITELPAVPERLLYLMGLSSTGYLAGKMARKAGPVMAEISVSPPDSDDGLIARNAAINLPDVTQPLVDARLLAAQLPDAKDANAQAAIKALKTGIDNVAAAHTTTDFSTLLTTLAQSQRAAEDAATASAMAAASATASPTAAADASAAQQAAAAVQRLFAAVLDAVATAAALQMNAVTNPSKSDRVIDIRGTNLSPEALFQIDQADLPFRMLVNAQGQHAPDLVLRDDTNPTLARLLRLTIVRGALEPTDSTQVDRWFQSGGRHTLSLTNPDGQKSELSFTLPPGETQKVGASS